MNRDKTAKPQRIPSILALSPSQTLSIPLDDTPVTSGLILPLCNTTLPRILPFTLPLSFEICFTTLLPYLDFTPIAKDHLCLIPTTQQQLTSPIAQSLGLLLLF